VIFKLNALCNIASRFVAMHAYKIHRTAQSNPRKCNEEQNFTERKKRFARLDTILGTIARKATEKWKTKWSHARKSCFYPNVSKNIPQRSA
jgi:hypothetical protein